MILNNSPLGKISGYEEIYNPALLYAIPRTTLKTAMEGGDLWRAFEVTWLNLKGRPTFRILEFFVPRSSSHIVESKSLKLYLNSFCQSRFEEAEVLSLLERDLSACVGARIKCTLLSSDAFLKQQRGTFEGILLDELELATETFEPCSNFLKTTKQYVSEKLYSHLFRSRCPVTGQPDYATIVIDYTGDKIDPEGLLSYLVSFRRHQDFHEACIERIFEEILERCHPEMLNLRGLFSRRGGIEIHPVRKLVESSKS